MDTDAVPTNYPWAQLKALPSGLEVTSNNSTAMTVGFIKPGSVLEDDAIRGAFLTAINPARWVADAYGDYGQAAKSLFPVAMLEPTTPYAFPTDLDAAKAAVAAKGAVSIIIGISNEDANSVRRLADLMVAELAAIGITAEVNVLPAGAQYGLVDNPNGPDFYFSKLTPDALHPETQATLFFTKTGALNFYGRANEEADALVNEAGTLTDIAARNALYEKASTMYIDSGLFVPLAEVQDVVVHALGLTDLGLRSAFPNGNIDYGTMRWAE
jgi:peptide/nickel transport system substrate-binding protein